MCKPRMVGCAATCLHYLNVRDYQQERERQEQYVEDNPEPVTAHPRLIDFNEWLRNGRRIER